MTKKLLYVTGSRAEYGIMKRLLLRLKEDNEIELTLIATGMHCDSNYGLTYKVIENDGFTIDKLIDININTDSNAKVLQSMAVCQTEFGIYLEKNKFDAIMLLGDRYEIFSVAIAAAMHNIPIIHLHGGEKTLGNYDEFIRHAITKMSRLHLASTDEYRNRIIQMGEHPDTVYDIGALGAENALLLDLPSREELEAKFGPFNRPWFMVVFHPETLTKVSLVRQIEELINALSRLNDTYDFIFIGSNSDTGSDEITKKIKAYCHRTNSRYFTSLKPEEYLALNKFSQGLIGNSSSGLIEIPSLNIPTINIGDRQKGRVRGDSVIDCVCEVDAIFNAIVASQEPVFKARIENATNPYYKQGVLEKALDVIKNYMRTSEFEYKDFYDLNI
ncbi:UDP-N-acetylglucosamine 2-epimerase [Paramixta manurensis]|uniref:UDP-N-acetylglucosamine 2-epimerase n=1 Tax=Paramixta manurensis TaxID=2740817 RepID=A0A6M8UJ41_9GAMM|nr:UDP-N-acetylglucosamine 2-epimerase [Erwiniaceae bacterium PD-1]